MIERKTLNIYKQYISKEATAMTNQVKKNFSMSCMMCAMCIMCCGMPKMKYGRPLLLL